MKIAPDLLLSFGGEDGAHQETFDDSHLCPRHYLGTNEEKRKSLLTLHARGYSVESNSQGSCSICISLEKEDKLDQRLTKAFWIVECLL